VNIIDQCVAQGVPFAREYGGLLANRSFGGAQVSRTFYARGQTGQQLLLGAYSALCDRSDWGISACFPARRWQSWSSSTGAPGHRHADLVTGDIVSHTADAVVLAPAATATRSTSAPTPKDATPPRSGAPTAKAPASPILLHPDPSDLHPGDRRAPVEAHPDERVAAQRRAHLGAEQQEDRRGPNLIPDAERDYFLERRYPAFGNLVPRDVASRAAKERCDAGYGVGATAWASTSISKRRSAGSGAG